MFHSRVRASALGLILPLLAACATGGGGSGTPGQPSIPPPAPPPPPPAAYDPPPLPPIATNDPANTAEFRVNYGLRSLNAHAAYARGGDGAGILVAVIDDGIDIDHPDLDDNLSDLSRDIRTGNFADLDTTETHGTQIAGIIAAERNEALGHGVASKLSSRLGEGVVNGLLTSRFGIAAMDLCRPLPFAALPRPTIGSIAKVLARRISAREQ